MLSARPTEAPLEALAGYTSEPGTTRRRAIAEALAAKGVKVVARDSENRPRQRGRAGTEDLEVRHRRRWRTASPAPASPVWRGAPHPSRRLDGAGMGVWQQYACNRTYCVLLPAGARDGRHRSDYLMGASGAMSGVLHTASCVWQLQAWGGHSTPLSAWFSDASPGCRWPSTTLWLLSRPKRFVG